MSSSRPQQTMPSQRPFFLSTFFAALRQQTPSGLSSQQPSKSASSSTYQPSSSPPGASSSRTISTSAAAGAASPSSPAQAPQPPPPAPSSSPTPPAPPAGRTTSSGGSVVGQLPIHSPRPRHPGAVPIPGAGDGRRRGSDSSSEGFREVLGADKWYIGGRTATGEERFFKLGVVRRVRSGDRLSLDRLSL